MKTKLLFAVIVIQLMLVGVIFAQSQPAGGISNKDKPAESTAKPAEKEPAAAAQKPESAPEKAVELTATVSKIDGEAEVKKAGEKDWIKAVVGMALKEGSLVSTGFKSEVLMLFADNSTVIVKQLTQMKIASFEQDKDTVKTNLRLRVGSVQVKVKEKQPVKTDMKISTPNATASVRGTELQEVKASSHFGDSVAIASGRIIYGSKQGSIPVKGGESTNQNLINPILNLIMQTMVNVAPVGSTNLETQQLLTSSSAQGATLSGQNTSGKDPALAKFIFGATKPVDIYEHWYPINYVGAQ